MRKIFDHRIRHGQMDDRGQHITDREVSSPDGYVVYSPSGCCESVFLGIAYRSQVLLSTGVFRCKTQHNNYNYTQSTMIQYYLCLTSEVGACTRPEHSIMNKSNEYIIVDVP